MMNLGDRLKDLRSNHDLTLSDLSLKTGIGKSTISEIETGKAKNPKIETLSKIADYFGVSTDFLIYGFDKKLLSQLLNYVIDKDSYNEFAEKADIDKDELTKICEGTITEQPSKETIKKLIDNTKDNLIFEGFELFKAAGYIDEAENYRRIEEAKADFSTPLERQKNLNSNESHLNKKNKPNTIAAHLEGEELTEEEEKNIREYIDFILSKRKKQ